MTVPRICLLRPINDNKPAVALIVRDLTAAGKEAGTMDQPQTLDEVLDNVLANIKLEIDKIKAERDQYQEWARIWKQRAIDSGWTFEDAAK